MRCNHLTSSKVISQINGLTCLLFALVSFNKRTPKKKHHFEITQESSLGEFEAPLKKKMPVHLLSHAMTTNFFMSRTGSLYVSGCLCLSRTCRKQLQPFFSRNHTLAFLATLVQLRTMRFCQRQILVEPCRSHCSVFMVPGIGTWKSKCSKCLHKSNTPSRLLELIEIRRTNYPIHMFFEIPVKFHV